MQSFKKKIHRCCFINFVYLHILHLIYHYITTRHDNYLVELLDGTPCIVNCAQIDFNDIDAKLISNSFC